MTWFDWLSVAEGELPEGATVSCGMLGDQPCMRLLWGGVWTAETRDGHMVFDPGEKGITLYFGPQSRYMPISVTGSYRALTMHLATGAPAVLAGPTQIDLLDRIEVHEDIVGHGKLTSKIPLEQDYECWMQALEEQLRKFLDATGRRLPDPLSASFERECIVAPDFTISEFAAAHGVSTRTVERAVRRDFGVSPTFALRRARALDMAAALLDVAEPGAENEIRLRYFDQSHLIREIRHFFGMKPSELSGRKHPLLSLNMESRQRRRMQALAELEEEGRRGVIPWRERSTPPAT
ncbi:helix-turn-helix domain-containing protein [Qipengyuania soli]|uniref:Helix-turn-helix domain-containing protein n=1 Tax=Qipengyuania soli TaxID=2782568 RepID=A0A7S8F3R6_9SPHN|nr:helix-turn-helix domain-containing protein [Qipengyuania soli]QPC98591.1 helix-turn-helix domain-containing protein [Qipengyuania soli]